MDVLKMGQELLGDKLGDMGGVMDALSGLTGVGDQVSSWMGDGENQPVSADQLTEALGADKMGEVASTLGVDAGTAAESLSQAMPTLMDKVSSAGSVIYRAYLSFFWSITVNVQVLTLILKCIEYCRYVSRGLKN